MKYKDILKNNPFTVSIILFAIIISGVTFYYSTPLAFIELAIIAVLSFFAVKLISKSVDRRKAYFRNLEASLTGSGDIGKYTLSFPFPFIMVNSKGDIEWFNSYFENILSEIRNADGNNIRYFISDTDRFLRQNNFSPFEMRTDNSYYTVYPSKIDDDLYCLYFVDDTKLKKIGRKYFLTRPAVILINVDSLEYTGDSLAHADYNAVVSDVEREITKWLVDNRCIFRKFADGKFFAVTECSSLDNMVQKKFNILDKIRLYRFREMEMDITLSVGVGKGSSLFDCEINARQALDMARGRGGDQVALKNGDSYEFFGGITDRKEKRGKIKSRFFAAMLDEHINNCAAVFVMGHSYSDFDAIGAAVGVAAIAKSCKKPVHIVVNEKTSLALPLIKLFDSLDRSVRFISPKEAFELADDNSLLVITDTMCANLLDAPSIFDKTGKKVIIDHHRMTVDRILDVSLFFHEPYASSTCEMVAELVQYAPSSPKLTAYEAEALLAGIILDTKNFTLRVGTRTFEAATYLKDSGADTVRVRKLFACSVEENLSVSRLITSAEFYKNYAVAVAKNTMPVSRLVASKTADELLNINGVDASFVITECNNIAFISARSFGKINVQLVMEALGGGGHQSMAACQMSNCDTKKAKEMLKNAVDAYIEKNLCS